MSRRVDPDAYVLGLLDPDEHAEAVRLEQEDPAFAAAVVQARALVGTLGALEDEDWAAAAPPPPLLRSRPAGARPVARRSAPWAAWRRPLPALAAALLLLAVGGVAGAGLRGGGETVTVAREPAAPSSAAVALQRIGEGPPGAGAEVRMAASRTTGRMVLHVHGLRPTRRGEHYELWLLRDPAKGDLVSVGSFRVDARGRATVEFPLAVDPSRFRALDVSLQRDDRGPAHSGVSVLRSSRV
ncbi:anti-sigma factor [Patulibacter brassicae]|uniref:Anti-sigma factor n=1 Tax=Patulibacter brassicae TaxID=1705717 RepID=A0ABU4VI73_9ACTN|nr:anti-sigma factor [Patulibacter brassicae]MDX8150631.1 anti-sigma factor [Patulibacter brassicae]